MNRPGRTSILATSTLVAAGLAGGLAGTATAAPPATRNITIHFRAVNGTTPVSCGTALTDIGVTKTTAALRDLRFYISNVRMVRANGRTVPLALKGSRQFNFSSAGNAVTLVDLENGQGLCTTGSYAMNRSITGTVPKGRYVGVRMFMGVPFPMNHTDITTAPPPLAVTAMNWSWQSGRKFSKIEIGDPGGTTGSWASKTFYFHLGSTGCVGNPATGATTSCKASNRAAIPFATRMNPDTQAIAVDLGALFAGNDVTVNRAGPGGCMGGATDPECGPVFDALQVDWRADGSGTGQPIDGGRAQRVFRVVAR